MKPYCDMPDCKLKLRHGHEVLEVTEAGDMFRRYAAIGFAICVKCGSHLYDKDGEIVCPKNC